jgi:hypothetical protein
MDGKSPTDLVVELEFLGSAGLTPAWSRER